MTDMYWQYCKHLEGIEMTEHEHGFATYKFVEFNSVPGVYLQDIYVKPEYRRSQIATELLQNVETIGRHNDCKQIWATCDPNYHESTNSMKAILASNFQLSHINAGLIWLAKDL